MPIQLRKQLNLYGQVPSVIESLEQQANRAMKLMRAKFTPFEKYMFMAQLRNNNTRVFYKLINDHIEVSFFLFVIICKLKYKSRNSPRLFIPQQLEKHVNIILPSIRS